MSEGSERSVAADPLAQALELFWHPVCTTAELTAAGDTPFGVELLGRRVVVARAASGTLLALADRCLHRSTRLSIGRVDGESIRCAYHGWRWAADGHCVEIPSMPGSPIPDRACIPSYDVEERYGLVWVRLDASAGTTIPAHPAFDLVTDRPGSMRIVAGEPY
ncbi:MAG: Rieske 2Fe-2S domain-containing protein, partial [Ilumatobacteraceae bacterium]